MNNFLKKLKHYIEHSSKRAPVSPEEKTRLEHYTIFVFAGVPTMVIYGIYNLITENILLFNLIFLSAFGLSAGWFLLRKMENGRIIYRINAIFFGSLLIYMFFIGGEEGSKSLWMYTFPLISFFLFGKNEGIFWNLSVLIFSMIILFLPIENAHMYNYTAGFKSRFLTSYVIVSAVTYWFEYFRYYYRNRLEIKNENLQREITERKKIEQDKEKLIVDLKKALDEVKTLSGLLPICASCKKIRDDKGLWNKIENYIQSHSEAQFSHSICPDCTEKLYPDL